MLPTASLSRFLLLLLRLNPTERLIHGSPSQSQEEGLVCRARLEIGRLLLLRTHAGWLQRGPGFKSRRPDELKGILTPSD
jgi:hypothetical protein